MLQPFRLSKAFFTFGFGWFPGGRCLSCELLCLAVLCKQTCSHLDLIYLAATQARMVKRDFASPSRVLFVLLRKTKTHRPRTRTRAAMASSRPNVFLRSAKKNCPRVPLTGRSGIFRMPSRATSSNSKCHLHATGLHRAQRHVIASSISSALRLWLLLHRQRPRVGAKARAAASTKQA